MIRFVLVLVLCVFPLLAGAGETEKIIQFNITGSQTTHAPRTYDVQLSAPTNGTLGTPSSTTLTINSGSGATPGTLTIRMVDPLVDRAGTAGTTQRFAIDRAGDTSGTASVTWTVTGTGDTPAVASDFSGGVFPTGSAGFAAAESSKTITINITGKTAPSSTITYLITLSNPVGANLGTPASVTAQVQNAGEGAQVTWSISTPTPTVDRGENGTTQSVEISRTSGAGAATITYQTAPGGTVPAEADDFVPAGFPTATASFADLETIKRLTWSIAGKTGSGPTVTYDAAISSPSVGTIGTGSTRLTVTDSGPAPNVTLPLRINSGATALYVDGAGAQWGADAYYTGGSVITTASAISGTTDDTLYTKQRLAGPVKYTLNGLPTGQTYDVQMLFAEIEAAQSGACTLGVAGARRMDLYSNGVLVQADIDPCKAVGFAAAHVREFRALTADANGSIVLELRANANATVLPALAGFYARVTEEPAMVERYLFFGRPGAPPYANGTGKVWVPGDKFVAGCEAKDPGAHPVSGTDSPELYQSQCEGRTLTIRLPIDITAGADRTVYLGFAEHTATGVGQRPMNITVEGAAAAVGLDVITAAGGLDKAYRIRRDVTLSDGFLDIIITGTGTMPAILNNLSVITPTVAPVTPYVASASWKSEFLLPKNTIVRAFAPPRGVADSGNPLVVRAVDDSESTMFVNHAPCPASPTHGTKTDTTATNNNFYLCITTRDPAAPGDSLFTTLAANTSVIDTFTVQVCEADRTTGNELNCQPFSVGVRVSRGGTASAGGATPVWSDDFNALSLEGVTANPVWTPYFKGWGVHALDGNSDKGWKDFEENAWAANGTSRTVKQIIEAGDPTPATKTRYLHDVSGGTIKLRCYKNGVPENDSIWGYSHSCGMINSEVVPGRAAATGYWETRMKINSLTKGQHLAIWLVPQDSSAYPPEIDIGEWINDGGDNTAARHFMNVHGETVTAAQTWDTVSDPYGWKTYGLEITADQIKWYRDGVLVRTGANRFTTDELANQPAQALAFMISPEHSGNWPGLPDGTTVYPFEAEVDYVRYYSTKP